MSRYSELLRDPRWQRKRLQVLERDGFRCRECGDKEKTLNVHHCWYEKGKNPWEYPEECYRTLCDECHVLRADAEISILKFACFIDSRFLHHVLWTLRLMAGGAFRWQTCTKNDPLDPLPPPKKKVVDL